MSAWGRNSNAGSAEQASFAALNGCESWGRSLPRPVGPGRHRWSGHRSGQGCSGRRLPGAHHLGPVLGTGSRVAPGSGPGAARWRRRRRGDARASASVGARCGGRNGDEVTAPRLAVLRLRGLDAAQGCQLIPACAPAVWAARAGLATAKFADWRADGERAVISPGVDGKVFYLWVRTAIRNEVFGLVGASADPGLVTRQRGFWGAPGGRSVVHGRQLAVGCLPADGALAAQCQWVAVLAISAPLTSEFSGRASWR